MPGCERVHSCSSIGSPNGTCLFILPQALFIQRSSGSKRSLGGEAQCGLAARSERPIMCGKTTFLK